MLPPVGRRPTKNLNLPCGMRARVKAHGRVYYYFDTGAHPRREIPLGCDYPLAVKQWAELAMARDGTKPIAATITFKHAAERYQREIFPSKAPRTQRDNLKELAKLYEFFDDPSAPLDEITPQHVRQYLDSRRHSSVRANREKALLSHIFNKAREWGFTDRPNPCQGVKGFTEQARNVYVDDDTFKLVWEAADRPTRDAMTLAYLTGQRPADVLRMRLSDVKDGLLSVTQGKTGKKLRISVEGQLLDLVTSIQEQKFDAKVTSIAIIRDERGRALSYGALDGRFEKARDKVIAELAADLICLSGMDAQRRQDQMAAIRAFQFRDLRAKAGTDKADSTDIREAQRQLGHNSIKTTEIYLRARVGERVKPTK